MRMDCLLGTANFTKLELFYVVHESEKIMEPMDKIVHLISLFHCDPFELRVCGFFQTY